MFFVFLSFAISIIPEQFRALAERAILNSTIKVPKNLREDTKYPGNYSFDGCNFTLFKILTSSQTNDIKGYAIENNYAAIVKRKKFSIENGFALIDIKTDEFYSMEEIVASNDKVYIYKTKPLHIFNIFSEIKFKIKRPKMSLFKRQFNWDSKRDRPLLKYYENFGAGAGAYLNIEFEGKAFFKSIVKAEIVLDITIIGKIGAEIRFNIADGAKIENIPLFEDIDIPIPEFAIDFKFLHLEFKFGLFLSFGAVIPKIEYKLNFGVSYFKGYQFIAKRYIYIKRHGHSDSGWQTEFSQMPTHDIVDSFLEGLQSNYITAGIGIKQALKVQIKIASVVRSDIQIGLMESFVITFGFSPFSCPFPYMYGKFEFPLSAYFSFSGIDIKIKHLKKLRIRLMKPIYKEVRMFDIIKTKKFCLFNFLFFDDYDITEPDDGYEDDYNQYINETSNRIIYLGVDDLENVENTHSLMSLNVALKEYNYSTLSYNSLYIRRTSHFEDITSKKSDFDAILVAKDQNKLTTTISICFEYITGPNSVGKSIDFFFFLKDYKTKKDSDYMPIATLNSNKTEKITAKLRLNYCENVTFNDIYVPSLQNGMIETDFEFGEYLCLIVKDIGIGEPDHVDENATFITDGTLSKVFIDKCLFEYNDEYFQIHLLSINLPSSPDPGTLVKYEIRAEWGDNYKSKSVLISDFSNKFSNGVNYITDDYKPKFRLTKSMRLYISISYYSQNSIINMEQPMSYSEVQNSASLEKSIIIKKEPNSKISCIVDITRYKPMIIVNCSQENSTHRIITNCYILKQTKPSENEPQKITFNNDKLYGVLQIKKVHPNINWVIIHMPLLTPLCNFTIISDDYYQIPFIDDTLYILFRRQNTSFNNIIINHVIQGNFVDEETIYFSSKYYTIDFRITPIALVLVRTVNNQYSVYGVENTKQTLIDYGNEKFQILALEYDKDEIITIASSLIIIDDRRPLAEKTIPNFNNIKSVVYQVWCDRADELIVHDKTTGITTEKNTQKIGSLFKISVTPNHVVDFIPLCSKNKSQSMCYFKQVFDDSMGYAIFRFPDKDGITILDTTLPDLFEQEDRQGLIEEVIRKNNNFYYMSFSTKPIHIIGSYKTKIDLELRITDIEDKYKRFCLVDHNGYIVPVSRSYYTDDYTNFMNEFGIDADDEQYYDFVSGSNDSCLYATYTDNDDEDDNVNNDDTEISISRKKSQNRLSSLSDEKKPKQIISNISTKVCDIAKTIKVLTYKNIKKLILPKTFDIKFVTMDYYLEGSNYYMDNFDAFIYRYFEKIKHLSISPTNNSFYVLYVKYMNFTFMNYLDEDEYISSNNNMTIYYKYGNLNYILPENFQTIIYLGSKNEVNISLYGNGTVNIISYGNSTLKINGVLNIDSSKILYVNDHIKHIIIEKVNFAQHCEFYALNDNNEKVNITILNSTLYEHSVVKLSCVDISDTFLIKQTATAIVDDTVTFQNSNLFIDMIIYQNDLIPMITGNLTDPPKSITIQQSNENSPTNVDDEFLIFDGVFNCELWINKINFNNKYFNTARCTNHSSIETRILTDDENRSFISFAKKPQTIIKEYYYPGGLIAIIIFAILDALLLAAIILFLYLNCSIGILNDISESC